MLFDITGELEQFLGGMLALETVGNLWSDQVCCCSCLNIFFCIQEKNGNGVATQEDADLAADADSQPVGNNYILRRYCNKYLF